MKKLITILALGLASILHAGEDSFAFKNDSLAVANDISFSHLSVFLEGGGVHYTYWENVDGVVMFQYTYFKPRLDIPYDGVHQFMGRVGADWKWKTIHPVVLGAGFSCSWTRADVEKYSWEKQGGSLTDNETEFGWYARISLPVFRYKEYSAGFHVMWEQLWTLPKRSNMLYAGLTFERSIW